MDNNVKSEILLKYLDSQQDITSTNNKITLEDFKKLVVKYFEIDNYIVRLKVLLKEKKDQKNELSKIIAEFMEINEIDDVNTKNGRIRYKRGLVKGPQPSKKHIKEKIEKYLNNLSSINKNQANDILSIFNDNDTSNKIEKVTLRRLKIS